MSEATKPYGHAIKIECCDRMLYIPGSDLNTVHHYRYRGSESVARRKVRLKPNYCAVLSVTPLTQDEWERLYGVVGWRM